MSLSEDLPPPLDAPFGSRSGSRESRIDFLRIAVIASAAMVATVHFTMGLEAPLWFDESWTGALASIDGPRELAHQLQEEAGGPTYYILAWLWAHAFGSSNISLHSLSLLLALPAPFIAWLAFRKTHPRLAVTWAVLLAIWGPNIAQSGFARCYPLLFDLAIATTVAYIRLLESPTLRRTCVWMLLASATVLTHYDAGILIAGQGMFFILRHRRLAFRNWPALLIFIPSFAWITLVFNRLALMSAPGVTWYPLVDFEDLPFVVSYFFGAGITITRLAVGCALACQLLMRPRSRILSLDKRSDNCVLMAGIAGCTSILIFIALSMLRPMFTFRYLIPFEPSFALLVAFWMVELCRENRARLGLLLLGSIVMSAFYWVGPLPLQERIMNFEVASQWISETSPSTLVFFWDNPTALTVAKDQMDLVGGFFLHRSGLNTKVETVFPEISTDMNASIAEKVGHTGSLIWIFDKLVTNTTAIAYPPTIESFDQKLECRDFGKFRIEVLACRQRKAAPDMAGS